MTALKVWIREMLRRGGRTLYWRLSPRWRDVLVGRAFTHAGALFRGLPAYEIWRRQAVQRTAQGLGLAGRLTGLNAVRPLHAAPGRIAVHAHLYYPDLAGEFAARFRCMPFPFDLYVSVADAAAAEQCRRVFAGLAHLQHLSVEVVANRGRDLAPMLCAFGERLQGYDLIAHVHSKKSLYNRGATDGWRGYLLASLFGSADRLRRIFALLAEHDVGMVFPQSYARVPYFASTWLANRAQGTAWAHRLGVRHIPAAGYFDFPVGSMFWARVDALRPLFEAGIALEDFPAEQGQSDGTLAHALERLLGVVALDSGRPLAILPDSTEPSWSQWRFEQYLRRDRQVCEALLGAAQLRLLVFDVFDTLLLRPLVEPERIKDIVARRAGGDLGVSYLRWRASAEAAARQAARRDVGLDEIYVELGRCAALDQEQLDRLRELELAVELAAVTLRPGADILLGHALTTGTPVVLASDMYLPRQTIEAMLAGQGLSGWQQLYLSSEVGLRKDGGGLYRHILERHGLAPGAVMMVGDNERSDLQIPLDMGMRSLHLLRPLELARAMPRLRPLVERVEHANDVDAHLALGLVVRGQFGALFPARFDAQSLVPDPTTPALGYAVLGPLVLAFTQWLIERARQDGIDRLYFLAREGEFLKQVYERVTAGMTDAPSAHYLVVSRRAVILPAIRNLDDALAIAATDYGPATVDGILRERFGIALDEPLARDLEARGVWRRGQILEIRQRDVSALRPLLEALLPMILAQGRQESAALHAYLAKMGLDAGTPGAAVVDVGYSATIQRYLNALLGGGLNGYYMATFEHTETLWDDFAARAWGCFFHQVPQGPDSPLFMLKSFVLEKMLSADSAQVVSYALDRAGDPVPRYRPLSDAELATRAPRAALRGGAMRLVDDALQLRQTLLGDFCFPTSVALGLCEALIDAPSPPEAALLRDLVLDDHYCGRGVVA